MGGLAAGLAVLLVIFLLVFWFGRRHRALEAAKAAAAVREVVEVDDPSFATKAGSVRKGRDPLDASLCDPHGIAQLIFSRHDADGSGRLDCDELRALCAEMGYTLSPEEVNRAMMKLDEGGTGTVSLQDFLYWYSVGMSVNALFDDGLAAQMQDTLARARAELQKNHDLAMRFAPDEGRVEATFLRFEREGSGVLVSELPRLLEALEMPPPQEGIRSMLRRLGHVGSTLTFELVLELVHAVWLEAHSTNSRRSLQQLEREEQAETDKIATRRTSTYMGKDRPGRVTNRGGSMRRSSRSASEPSSCRSSRSASEPSSLAAPRPSSSIASPEEESSWWPKTLLAAELSAHLLTAMSERTLAKRTTEGAATRDMRTPRGFVAAPTTLPSPLSVDAFASTGVRSKRWAAAAQRKSRMADGELTSPRSSDRRSRTTDVSKIVRV